MTESEFQIPVPISIESSVYRQVHFFHLQGPKKGRFPKESHFKPDSDGLSVHWDKFIDVHGVYHIIGLSYKKDTTVYKNCRDYKVFTLPVSFLRALEGIEAVEHSPIYNGNPAPLGSPNNYAHSSVVYPDDEEIRMKLSAYCNDSFSDCYCPVDLNLVEKEVEQLKERLNETPFHRLSKGLLP